MRLFIFKLKHNKLIRFLLKPLMEIKSFFKQKSFNESAYPELIRKYKNKYSGKRCFIIGNGPSLNPNDLEQIKDEFSFAANRIYNIFDKTNWRPTFYVSTDMDIIRQELDNIKKIQEPIMFMNYDARKYFKNEVDKIIYLFLKGRFEIVRNRFVQNGVSNDVAKYSTKTQTVTCVSIELAMYMGFSEIFLLGVDHNFSKYVDSDGKLVEDKTVQNYFSGMKGGEQQAILYVDDTTACYEMVKRYAEQMSVNIFNLTRGGKLEVFERRKLEDVL